MTADPDRTAHVDPEPLHPLSGRDAATGAPASDAPPDDAVEVGLPDQVDAGGPIDGGNAGLWQPNALGGPDDGTDWEDRQRIGGPKEEHP